MKRKDNSVEMNIHPVLTNFLFYLDGYFRAVKIVLVITSGSESGTRHIRTSLHYATPACAVDIRSRTLGESNIEDIIEQAAEFCEQEGIPVSWIEVIEASTHLHIEYQPKRQH